MKYYFLSFFIFFAFFPLTQSGVAHADTMSVCATSSPGVSAGKFVPYVYEDGDLHSFDYILATATPKVSASATVGAFQLSPSYITLWGGTSTISKIHVDVPVWYALRGTVPIKLTVDDGSGCSKVFNFNVVLPIKKSTPVSAAPWTRSGSPHTQGSSRAPETAGSPSISCAEGKVSIRWTAGEKMTYNIERRTIGTMFEKIFVSQGKTNVYEDTSLLPGKTYEYRIRSFMGEKLVQIYHLTPCTVEKEKSVEEKNESVAPMPMKPEKGGDGKVSKKLPEETGGCRSLGQSVWLFLLVVYLGVSLAALDSLKKMFSGNGTMFTAALFVPFVIALGTWFVFESCRNYQWFPITVAVITLITLLVPTFLKKRFGPTISV